MAPGVICPPYELPSFARWRRCADDFGHGFVMKRLFMHIVRPMIDRYKGRDFRSGGVDQA
jgi:hypothetical protein